MLRNYRLQNYNIKLVLNVLVLATLGIIFIHSANPSFVMKQGLGLILCFAVMAVVSLIDYQTWLRSSNLLYIINLLLLIGVKLFGKDVNGAKRWFSLGPLGTLQPSELSKIVMIIVIADFVSIGETCTFMCTAAVSDSETAESVHDTGYRFYHSCHRLCGRIKL